MKNIDKINQLYVLMYDSETARNKDWLLKLNKIYNGNKNDPLEVYVKGRLKKDEFGIKKALDMWVKDKLNVWWINQDPEVRPLNNFSKHQIYITVPELDTVPFTCKTTEAYFQAAKFFRTDRDWARKILLEPNPAQTKNMGNSREHPIDPNWNNGVSVQRMTEALFAKYGENEEVRDALALTEDKMIIERADWDPIWGDGPDGNGKNYLGKCWMFIRSVML